MSLAKFFLLLTCVLLTFDLNGQKISSSSDGCYLQSYQLMHEGRYSLALDMINKAIVNNPSWPEAYKLRAEIQESIGLYKDALTNYSIALHLDPSYYSARFQRAINYYTIERYSDAKADLIVLLRSPMSETTTVYFKGKSDHSGFTGSQVTSLESNMQADLYSYLSLINLATGNIDSAFFYIDKSILQNPNEADYYSNRALIHQSLNDTASAIKDYQFALGIDSDHFQALNNLHSLSDKHQYDHLLAETYDMAVRSHKSYQAYLNRAIHYQSLGNHKQAIEDFSEALKLTKEPAEVHLLRGYSYERLNLFEEGEHDYSLAIKFDPALEKAYSNRANSYYKLKKYRLAISDYNKSISMNPGDPKLYYNRGLALYLIKRKNDACTDLNKAYNLGFKKAEKAIDAYCNEL